MKDISIKSQPDWRQLFSIEGPASILLQFREVRRHGEPLLLLPGDGRLDLKALRLYPAQSLKARSAQEFLSLVLRWRFPVPLPRVSVSIGNEDKLVRLLQRLSGTKPGETLFFAIFVGNPATIGRRFLLVPFDAAGREAAVVKAGIGAAAHALIEKEISVLASLPQGVSGVPVLRETFANGVVRALVLNFVEGSSPPDKVSQKMALLLNSWLHIQRCARVAELPLWKRLEAVCKDEEAFRAVAPSLRGRLVHTCLLHGDFAPWNIKVSPKDGSWTVLDWERGDVDGIPGWDWLHFLLQPAILVRHQPVELLAEKLERRLFRDPFATYAAHAGLLGVEREVAISYLLHMLKVVEPAGGKMAMRGLLSVLCRRWLKL